MNQQKLKRLIGVSITGVLMVLNGTNVWAVTPACGTVLTADTTFNSDLLCAETAVYFNAGSDNVDLDCAGFSITTTDQRAISASTADGISIQNCNVSTNHTGGRGMVFTAITNSVISNNVITTTGDSSRAIQLRGDSNSNTVSGNTVHTSGASSVGIRLEASANNNVVTDNRFQADDSRAFSIRSSSGNLISDNTLISPVGYVQQVRHSLQNGGLSVDNAGTVYAVENNWGSSAGGGLGIGEGTALFQVDPDTGLGHSVIQLLLAGSDVGFGFDSLEILPVNGRFIATPGASLGTSQLYEINPNSGEVSALGLTDAAPPNDVKGDINGLQSTSATSLLATTNRGELASIDLNTMVVTLIGSQSTGWTDLATHPTNGKTYAVSRRRNEASDTAHLYEIDTGNGAIISEIGDTGSVSISDIDFAPDGTLYANYGLIIIDTSTGLGTVVGEGWFGADPLEPLSQDNRLENMKLQSEHGEILFTGSVTLPSIEEVDMSASTVQIQANRVSVDSAVLPFLDHPARITLSGLEGKKRELIFDENDDGDFEDCPQARCTLVDYSDGNLVFDVTGFSTYSSEEKGGGGGSLPFLFLLLLAPISVMLIIARLKRFSD